MKTKNNAFVSSMILAILFVVFGLLLLIFPTAVINIVAYILAVGVACIGLFGLYKFFLSKDESNYSKYGLAYGILFLILAVFVILRKGDIIKILPYTIGAIMLVASTLKIDYILELKKNNNENWKVTCAVTVICFLLGIILLFFPIEGLETVIRIIGLVIIFYSILDIINTYIIKTNLDKKPSILVEETITITPVKEEKKEEPKPKETKIVEKSNVTDAKVVKTVTPKTTKKAPVKKATTKTIKKEPAKKVEEKKVAKKVTSKATKTTKKNTIK